MDTITHGLLGATIAQLGFRQRIGREATLVAAAAAIVPDLDIFIVPLMTMTGTEADAFSFMTTHRGLSHSLLVIPLLSLPIALLWWWFKRGPNSLYIDDSKSRPVARGEPFLMLYLCVFLAMVSHPLLDWCTSYGTQLFAPLTNHRYSIDAVPIVDIIYSPLLIMTLIGCYVARKVQRESRKTTLIIGWVGFGLSVGYLSAGYAARHYVQNRARTYFAVVEGNASSNPHEAEYRAYPQFGTIFVWRVTRSTADSWSAMKVNLLFGVDLEGTEKNIVEVSTNPWIEQARELDEVQVFKWFAMGQVRADYHRLDGRHIVEFHDMRYGLFPQDLNSIWFIRASFDTFFQTWMVEHVQRHRGVSLRDLAAGSWNEILTP